MQVFYRDFHNHICNHRYYLVSVYYMYKTMAPDPASSFGKDPCLLCSCFGGFFLWTFDFGHCLLSPYFIFICNNRDLIINSMNFHCLMNSFFYYYTEINIEIYSISTILNMPIKIELTISFYDYSDNEHFIFID